PPHARLVANYDDRKACGIQSHDCRRNPRQHAKSAWVIQIPELFKNCSISIEKNRRFQKAVVRQKPPPSIEILPLPPPSLDSLLSCNDGPSGSAAKNTGCSMAFLVQPCTSWLPARSHPDPSARTQQQPAIQQPQQRAWRPSHCQ